MADKSDITFLSSAYSYVHLLPEINAYKFKGQTKIFSFQLGLPTLISRALQKVRKLHCQTAVDFLEQMRETEPTANVWKLQFSQLPQSEIS